MFRTLLLLACFLSVSILAAQEKTPDKAKALSKVEQELIKLTNDARAKEKKPVLKPNDLLMQAARQHAENMAKQNQLSHVLDGKDASDRVKALGYEYTAIAENIAAGQPLSPNQVMTKWLGSEGHRTNLLGDEYAEIGVAQVKNAEGVYYVQVFAARK